MEQDKELMGKIEEITKGIELDIDRGEKEGDEFPWITNIHNIRYKLLALFTEQLAEKDKIIKELNLKGSSLCSEVDEISYESSKEIKSLKSRIGELEKETAKLIEGYYKSELYKQRDETIIENNSLKSKIKELESKRKSASDETWSLGTETEELKRKIYKLEQKVKEQGED